MTFHLLSWLLLLLLSFLISALTALTLSVVVKEIYWEAKRRRLPASIAWVGSRENEFFPIFRAWMRKYKAGLKTVEEGYKKVKFNLKKNKKPPPFFLPSHGVASIVQIFQLHHPEADSFHPIPSPPLCCCFSFPPTHRDFSTTARGKHLPCWTQPADHNSFYPRN